ncbi:cytochrome P450 [Roridomyces roridus]|uniref:Cytochrome P450 n=1 Tax=Roridomyces roridus TaxID=1738132 RepID=A0AAD7BZ16_9AGAR|nr:cytochrome P450 [Roridomyces roridus]
MLLDIEALTRKLQHVGMKDVGIAVASVFAYLLLRRAFRRRTTPLKGPSSNNFFFGVVPELMEAPDSGVIHEGWAYVYGSVFTIPHLVGSKAVILTDPKAIQHFFSRETYGYVQTPNSKRFLEKLLGRGLFWAEGDSHKRQRRALNPAFSNASIKDLTPIFYDSAYKAKAIWDRLIDGNPEGAIIEVQQWMNHVSLDTIGLAGFSHDFETLSGKTSEVATAFDELGSTKPSSFQFAMFLLSLLFPILSKIPTGRRNSLARLGAAMRGMADKFINASGTAKEAEAANDKSVIGLLVKSASTEHITQEEVIAQINVLLLAGYETTAISLTWALIELSRHADIQDTLRAELVGAEGADPTWDEFTNGLPFLDAFTCEILRIHPPLFEIQRSAAEDDILPLSAPIQSATGRMVDNIFITKGTTVTVPIRCLNRSLEFWGPDAKEFKPDRWLNPSADPYKAQELQGYRHLLTFSDGARQCLGKGFALAEFKAVLSVLVRNYVFELPKGPDTEIGQHRNLLPRPKVAGEEGYSVPLRVRHYVAE